MQAKSLTDLLKSTDKVAVSNITGREARKVSAISELYKSIIVGGWALGKAGERIEIKENHSIPVFADYPELIDKLPTEKHPNKIIIYSPPDAVYGEVKNIVAINENVENKVETIYIITENVSTEVSAKIRYLCSNNNIDVIGCNTLGVINATEQVRIGAVGGDQPAETFHPGSATIISNSGNMVNTIASYLYSAGIGTRFGISTGKDNLILTPMKNFLQLVEKDEKTRLVVLYIEPGGLYEVEAIKWLKEVNFSKPILVYISGIFADEKNLSLGHAGAVATGSGTSAKEKMEAFDNYFETGPFVPKEANKYKNSLKGLRVQVLHHLPIAARKIFELYEFSWDYKNYQPLKLNPWMMNLGNLAKKLPSSLRIPDGDIPSPYKERFEMEKKIRFGKKPAPMNMKNKSHASSNNGKTPRIYGKNLIKMMSEKTFPEALIISWTGYEARNEFEPKLIEQCLIAAFTNGPGTISAQASKLSASAGNNPNTAMIATLSAIGSVHGGNGSDAVKFLIDAFRETEIDNPYDINFKDKISQLALDKAREFSVEKRKAKEADLKYKKIPCLGHPVYKNDAVNYDPRERTINNYLNENNIFHSFLYFYHEFAAAMRDVGITKNVLAVNVDAAIACVWLGICWPLLREKKITSERAIHIPFLSFALARAAGGAGEYLDHNDYGSSMDMRKPASENKGLTKPCD